MKLDAQKSRNKIQGRCASEGRLVGSCPVSLVVCGQTKLLRVVGSNLLGDMSALLSASIVFGALIHVRGVIIAC